MCQICDDHYLPLYAPDASPFAPQFPPEHCVSCHRRVPERGYYIACGECGHAYATRWRLLWDYRVKRWQVGRRSTFLPREGWWLSLLGGWWWPSRIYFCQCCIHDF